MKIKNSSHSIADFGDFHHKSCQQLELFPPPITSFHIRQKPQITSIQGVPVTTRRRYQVMMDDRVIATHLDIDDAWEIAANCTGASEVDA
jgi:hypothetical protein